MAKSSKNRMPEGKNVDVKVIDRKSGKTKDNATAKLKSRNSSFAAFSSPIMYNSNKEDKEKFMRANKKDADSYDKKAKNVGVKNSTYKAQANVMRSANKAINKFSSPKGGRGVRGKGK